MCLVGCFPHPNLCGIKDVPVEVLAGSLEWMNGRLQESILAQGSEHPTSQKQLVPRSRTGQKQVELSALEDWSREYRRGVRSWPILESP